MQTASGEETQRRNQIRWTPRLIRQLRGKRTLAEFGELLGAPKNTIWRWESARANPDPAHSERLSELAERERFLKDWKLVGSITLVDDPDAAQVELAGLFRRSLERTAKMEA
jgi:hypothetical protein